jgi:hypothetical protein
VNSNGFQGSGVTSLFMNVFPGKNKIYIYDGRVRLFLVNG